MILNVEINMKVMQKFQLKFIFEVINNLILYCHEENNINQDNNKEYTKR